MQREIEMESSARKHYKKVKFIESIIISLLLTFNFNILLGQNAHVEFQSIKKGLPHQLVRSILNDNKGFIWFGTHGGLARYDGYDFRIYENNPSDSLSLYHNTVNALLEDYRKNIWIGTAEGLCLYDSENDKIKNYNQYIKDPLFRGNICVSSLYDDKKGNLWIGTIGNGLIKLNIDSLKPSFYFQFPDDIKSIKSNYVTSIAPIDGKIAVGTYEGIDIYDHHSNSFSNFNKQIIKFDNNTNRNISCLYTNDEKILWAGTPDGVYKVFKSGLEYKVEKIELPGNENFSGKLILNITGDNENNIWIGTDNNGLYCYNTITSSVKFYHNEEGNTKSISSNTISSILFDSNATLWIGASHNGINYFNKSYKRFEHFQRNIFNENTLSDDDVRAFVPDIKGNIWMATDGGGISKFDPSNRQFTKIINKSTDRRFSNDAVTSLTIDEEGNIWIGSWTGGIDKYSKDEVFIKNYKCIGSAEVGNNKVVSLQFDKKGRLWAGTSGSGIFLFDKSSDSFNPVNIQDRGQAINTPLFVTKIICDHKNNIWVGSLYGLFKINESPDGNLIVERFYNSEERGSISSNRISTIYEDSNFNIWVGTDDMGLNLYSCDSNAFTTIQKEDGLPNNSVKGIIEDKRGNLWISTYKSLSIFYPENKAFNNYDESDGLNVIGFYNSSCYLSEIGELYFGGSNGFVIFNTDKIKDGKKVKPVYLTDFKVFNKSIEPGTKGSPLKKSIDETERIVLSHKQSSFSIDFVSINFTSAKDQFAYILEGLEDDWNFIGSSRTASYTYIRPGNYVFKVRNSNTEGIWNDNPKVLEIKILPPWWKTIWSYIAFSIINLTLIIFILRLLLIKAKQSRDLELDKMKMQFFTNISHELRTPLSLILAPIENIFATNKLSGHLKDQLLVINKNANNLYRLINELMDFSKADENKLLINVRQGDILQQIRETASSFNNVAEDRKIKYVIESTESEIKACFDKGKIEKIIMNLLSNAFKYTPDNGEISIEVIKNIQSDKKYPDGSIQINVKDNGIGISDDNIKKLFNRFYQVNDSENINKSGTGIGLSLVKILTELHKGEVTVKSKKNSGTTFSVTLPLGDTLFKKEEITNSPTDLVMDREVKEELDENIDAEEKVKTLSLLVVEDNIELRTYLVSVLSEEYKIFEAPDGRSGLEIAVNEVPDLIISDVVMPNMSGYELCLKVKKNIITSHIPVILLTAKTTTDDVIEGTETGADAYITKPFSLKLLKASIKTLIETRRRIFKRFSQEVYILPKEMSSNNLDQEFLEKIIRHIDENISKEDLSVETLSAFLLMSRGHVWRKVKALTGQTVTEFIRTIRLKKSIKLIEEGQLNISEIAYRVGFASPAYFTKCFREHFGKSPSWFLSKKNKHK